MDGSNLLHVIVLNGHVSLLEYCLSRRLVSLPHDFFHRNRDGTFCELAVRQFEEQPRERGVTTIAAICQAFATNWHALIRPELQRQIGDFECTGLPPVLVDLTLQYLDGHGKPFEQN